MTAAFMAGFRGWIPGSGSGPASEIGPRSRALELASVVGFRGWIPGSTSGAGLRGSAEINSLAGAQSPAPSPAIFQAPPASMSTTRPIAVAANTSVRDR